jgi:HEAT repeat protein
MLLQSAILLLLVASPLPAILSFVNSQQSGDESVNAAIKRLNSADHSERRAAWEELVQLGPMAIKPLISLLESIKEKQNRFFLNGKEKEVAEAYERMQEAFRDGDDNGYERAREQLSKLDITFRLKRDVIGLLGELKAEEAVPVLIMLMWQDLEAQIMTDGLKTRFSDAMRALVSIGEVAVPSLIETLETAETVASSVRYNDAPQSDRWVLTVEDKVAQNKSRIQTRAIIVLGEIGDKRAVPVLSRMLVEANGLDEFQKRYIREAIEKIESKDE